MLLLTIVVITTIIPVMNTLRQEISKSGPFASAEQEAFLNLLRTGDLLMRDVEAVLKSARLSPTQYNVLRILAEPDPKSSPAAKSPSA